VLTEFVNISICFQQQKIVAYNLLKRTVLIAFCAETISLMPCFVSTTSSVELGEKIRKSRISPNDVLAKFVNISMCCEQQKIKTKKFAQKNSNDSFLRLNNVADTIFRFNDDVRRTWRKI